MVCNVCGRSYRKNGIDSNRNQKWRKVCKCDETLSPILALDDQLDIDSVIKAVDAVQENKQTSFTIETPSQENKAIKRTYVMKETTIRTLQKLKILYPIGATYDQIVNEAIERLCKELEKK